MDSNENTSNWALESNNLSLHVPFTSSESNTSAWLRSRISSWLLDFLRTLVLHLSKMLVTKLLKLHRKPQTYFFHSKRSWGKNYFFTHSSSLECNAILISSSVPAQSASAVCSIKSLNLVCIAESKVENVRQNIKMNLRNIINQGFTTCHKSNFYLIYITYS